MDRTEREPIVFHMKFNGGESDGQKIGLIISIDAHRLCAGNAYGEDGKFIVINRMSPVVFAKLLSKPSTFAVISGSKHEYEMNTQLTPRSINPFIPRLVSR